MGGETINKIYLGDVLLNKINYNPNPAYITYPVAFVISSNSNTKIINNQLYTNIFFIQDEVYSNQYTTRKFIEYSGYMKANESGNRYLYFLGVLNIDEFMTTYSLEQVDEGEGYFGYYDICGNEDPEDEYNVYNDAPPYVFTKKDDGSYLNITEAEELFSRQLTINVESDYEYNFATLWKIAPGGGTI